VHSLGKRKMVETLFNYTFFPNQLPYTLHGTLPAEGIFTEDVVGRITPLMTLSGKQLCLDYFLGTAPNSTAFNVHSITITEYIEQGNKALITMDQHFYAGGFPFVNLTSTGVWQFNSDNLIKYFDITIKNFAQFFVAIGVDFRNPAHVSQQIATTCATYAQYCNSTTDPNGYYANTTDCTNFLNAIPVGSPDDMMDMNSTWCRDVHSMMVFIRPQVHCPHVGRSGGDKCIPVSYQSFYDFPYGVPNNLPNGNDGNANDQSYKGPDIPSTASNYGWVYGSIVGSVVAALLAVALIVVARKKTLSPLVGLRESPGQNAEWVQGSHGNQ